MFIPFIVPLELFMTWSRVKQARYLEVSEPPRTQCMSIRERIRFALMRTEA
jgi:hypothetical protein